MTAGRKSSVPEDALWRAKNFTTKLDGLLEKRPGLKKWAQTIKVPTVVTGSNSVMDDFLKGLGGYAITDTSSGLIAKPTVYDGMIQTNVAKGTGNEVYQMDRDGTRNGTTWSLRFQFKGVSLPAYTADGTVPNTFSFTGIAGAGTGKQFAIWSGGLYYKNNADDKFILIDDTEKCGEGGWVTIEVNVDDDSGSTTVYINDTLVATLTSADLKDTVLVALFSFRWEVEGTTDASAQYSTKLAMPMYTQADWTDADIDPFKTVKIDALHDYHYTSKAGSPKKSLLIAAGKYIYHDNGLQGAFRPLHTKQHSDVYFASFQKSTIWWDHDGGNHSSVWKWDGQGTKPELMDDAPVAHAGGEHQQRLWMFGPKFPLRLYYSGDRQPNLYFSPAEDNVEDEFSTLVNAGYLAIPSREKGDKITAFRGGYFGIAVCCTRHGAYRVLGSGINSYRLEKIGSSDAGGAENPWCIADMGNDLVTLSRKGLHAISATEQYGDLHGALVSQNIQDLWGDDPTSVETISREGLKNARLRYNPQQGLLYCCVPLTGDATAQKVYVFNSNTKQWAGPWTIDCQAIENVEISSPEIEVMMHAGSNGQVGYTDFGWKADFGTDGYEAVIESAFIDGRSLDPRLAGFEKTWKRLRIYVLPRGDWDFTVGWYSDDEERRTETVSQNDARKSHVLTEDFKLTNNPDAKLRSREQIVAIEIRLDSRGKQFTFDITSPALRGNDLVIQGVEVDFIPNGYEEE